MAIEVREVLTPADRTQIFSIREKVFVEEQQVPREDEYDEFEDTARHYLALNDGQPCGTARWRRTANGVKLERFAVLAPFRSQQVGSAVLTRVVQDARVAHPDVPLYLHAQVQAVPFYARHGFQPEGDLFYECEIPHYKMQA